jgi:hypothetical protein
MRCWDGTEFPVDTMLSPFETQEGRSVIATVRDIIVRKRVAGEPRKSPQGLQTRVRERNAGRIRANKAFISSSPVIVQDLLHANSG